MKPIGDAIGITITAGTKEGAYQAQHRSANEVISKGLCGVAKVDRLLPFTPGFSPVTCPGADWVNRFNGLLFRPSFAALSPG